MAEKDLQPKVGDVPRESQPDYKYRKALVTRIAKAVKGSFEDALRKESELCQRPFEKELANLDKILENGVQSRRESMTDIQLGDREFGSARLRRSTRSNGPEESQSIGVIDDDVRNDADTDISRKLQRLTDERSVKRQGPTPDLSISANEINSNRSKSAFASYQAGKVKQTTEPPTPPTSSEGESQSLSCGGISWYMEPFDPMGTTVHEERWTGRELVRSMSEDLSDMDEEELSGLHPCDNQDAPNIANTIIDEQAAMAKAKARKRRNARRRRWG